MFNVWFSANWNNVTDEAVGNTFVEWGKQNGGLKVEWQSIPGSPQLLAKQSAARRRRSATRGRPTTTCVYWYSQGEMADLKDLVDKFKDKAGGMYEIGISSQTAADGACLRRAVRHRRLAGPVADRRHRPGQQRPASSRPGTS